MIGFLLSRQQPPAPRRIKHDVVMRFDDVYEIDPGLMHTIEQDEMPAWDTHRIVAHRWDHLDWMHDHWADAVLSAEDLEEQ